MTSGLATFLIAAGLLVLTGFALSGLLVARDQAAEARLTKRIGEVLGRHAAPRRVSVTMLVRPAASRRSLKMLAASWFGFDPERPEQYPVPYWTVLIVAAVIAWAVEPAVGAMLGRLAWLVVPVAWILVSRMIFSWFVHRRQDKLLRQFPDALTMIVRSIRVGVPVAEAMSNVARSMPAPTGPEFAHLIEQLAVGTALDAAARDLAARSGLAEYRFFGTALSLQSQTGGGLSETLEAVADMIRKRLAVRARGHALASEAKMSIYVLASLPNLCGGALWMINPHYLSMLFTDPTGEKLLGGAIFLFVLGLMTMRTMMRRSLA